MVVVARPPGPKPLLPGRLLLEFRREPIELMTKIARDYGDIAHYRLAGREYFQLNSPEYIKEVLITKNRDFMKPLLLRMYKRTLGEGLLTSENEFHDRQRRLMRNAFHHESIRGYGTIMADFTKERMERWRDGETMNVHEEMMRLTLAIIAKSMFNTEVEAEAKEIGDAITEIIDYMDSMIGVPFFPLIERLPIPSSRRFRHAMETMDRVVSRIIAEHRSGEDQNDLLSMLLMAEDPENIGVRMTDVHLRDEAITILSAGHETTANLLTWTWYLLSENPEVEEKLHAELDRVLGGSLPRTDDVRKLPYTEMVLSEALRLYPPAWAIGREAVRDTTIGSYHIPKGAQVLMSQYVMHRDPRYYPNPERFDPERWTPELRSKMPGFAYFPFGGGPRVCIGEGFALMEAALVLATIAQKWKFRHVPTHKVELSPKITLRPKHGMMMTVSKREAPPAQPSSKEIVQTLVGASA